jgi:hypothetical protein
MSNAQAVVRIISLSRALDCILCYLVYLPVGAARRVAKHLLLSYGLRVPISRPEAMGNTISSHQAVMRHRIQLRTPA